MPRKDTTNDLESGNINLLPEEMRSAEDKDRMSARSNESPYQLRAPKKERRRRSAFAWLPFFGGTHWDASVEETIGTKGKGGIDSAAVRVSTKQPEPPRETSVPPPEERIRAVSEEEIPSRIAVLPTAKPSEKRGMRFPGLPSWFGRRRAGAPAPARQYPYPVSAPPRHYSLLDQEEKPATEVPEVPTAGAPSFEPRIEWVSTLGEAQKQTASGRAAAVRKGKRGIRWPRWLDIFYLIGRLTGPGTAKRIKMPHPPQPHTKHPQHETKPTAPVMPSLPTKPEKASLSMPETFVQQRGPITPIPEFRERPKRGFFAWLASLFEQKPKQPRVSSISHTPFATEKVAPPPPPKEEGRTEIRIEEIAPFPTPAPSVQKITESFMPFEHGPITPVPEPSVRRKRGFFAWLASLFARKPKPPKIPKIPHTPSPPYAFAPRPVEKPRPEVRVEQIVPVPTPEPPPQVMPTIPSRPAIDAVTPQPLQAVSEPSREMPVSPPLRPVTPEGPASLPAGKAHHGKKVKPPKEQRPTGLHMPTRLSFAGVAEGLREVNLIPGDFSLKSWKQISQLIALTLIAVAAVSGIAYALLNAWEVQIQNRTAEIDAEIKKFATDIQVFRNEEPRMTAIGMRIDLINQLLAKHIYWTRFLALLEKYTLPDVYYDGVSATTNGTLSLSAHGSNFETVTRTLLLLSSEDAQEFVTSVSVGGATRADSAEGVSRVDFIIDLTLNPSLFFYHNAAQTQ